MFKVGDKVKYIFDGGRALYGVIKEIDDVCDYKYYVYYNEDSEGQPLSIYDWEKEDVLELVAKGIPVDSDDAKFRAFLEKVANVNFVGYDEEYSMLEKIMNGDFGETERKEAIEELCDFYKDFNDRKRMTLAEIEKELGYKIEVVE